MGGVGGDLLLIDQVEPGDDLADQAARLAADVALPVDQQLIEKGQGLGLLPHGQIGEVLLKDVQIGPQLLPALGGAGGLDDVAEFLLVRQHVHQPQVVVHRQADQVVQSLLRAHQGGVLVGDGGLRVAGQGHIHPQAAHIVLKVVEATIHQLIPAALGGVHPVQLGQDDLEGLVQGIEHGDLPALVVPVLFGAEVGIDEQQGFHRQGLQLQVPHGVVGGDVADALQLSGGEPLVGVVVVEIGDPLPRPAAELAHVVGGGGGRDEGQVHLHPRSGQPPGGGHGDIVDPGHVAQGAEGGHLVPQAQQLIDELLPPGGQKAAILPPGVAQGIRLLGQELKINERVEGQDRALVVQQDLKHGEIGLRSGIEWGGAGHEMPVREHTGADVVIAEGQPALFRGGGEQIGQLAAQLQGLGAGEPLADGQQPLQGLGPARGLQQGKGGLSAGKPRRPPGGEGLGHVAVELSDHLFVHRGPPFLGRGLKIENDR